MTVLVAGMAVGVVLALQGRSLSAVEDPLRMLYGLLGLIAVVLPIAVLLPDRSSLTTPATPGSAPGDSA